MKIKVKSVNRRQPHNLNEELLCCHDCSAKRGGHPIDVVTFDVQIGDDHYVVEQPSVWPLLLHMADEPQKRGRDHAHQRLR